MNVDAYLARIGLQTRERPTLDSLERLQRAHLTAVPFENLHVFHRRGVFTDVAWSVPKIVDDGRGGWCFELNGAFAALLDGLGFSVKRLGAEVLRGPHSSGVADHLTLQVQLDRPYLVDVGFGDSFIRPLPLDGEGPLASGVGDFGFSKDGTNITLVKYASDGHPEPQYRFGPRRHLTSDFDGSSLRLQTEPGLQWTEAPFATRLLDGGPDRVTLLGDRLKFKRDGTWTEQPVPDADWAATLEQWFAMSP